MYVAETSENYGSMTEIWIVYEEMSFNVNKYRIERCKWSHMKLKAINEPNLYIINQQTMHQTIKSIY